MGIRHAKLPIDCSLSYNVKSNNMAQSCPQWGPISSDFLGLLGNPNSWVDGCLPEEGVGCVVFLQESL